jgi:predicted methyltransferase
VGPTGHVYAFIPAEQIANCASSEIAGAQALGREPRYANVSVLTGSLAELRPGGTFLVIDHVADIGSGLRDTETLHRIDPERMKQEIEAAGFILEAQSDVLRNADDDHRRSVFDTSIRGMTDHGCFQIQKALVKSSRPLTRSRVHRHDHMR